MTTRPDEFPDWAMLDVVSEDSGQNNAIEPPLAWQNYGWGYQEKPARNYVNWTGRSVATWLHFLDEQRIATENYLFPPTMWIHGTPDFAGSPLAPTWTFSAPYGWTCVATGGSLTIPIMVRTPVVITRARVKYHNAGTTRAPDVTLASFDSNIDAPASSQAYAALWNNTSQVTGGLNGVCDSDYGGPIAPYTIQNYYCLMLLIGSGVVGDVFSGVWLDRAEYTV